MTTPGQIAVVLVVLALIAGGSMIAWTVLFYSAARAESSDAPRPAAPGSSAERGKDFR